MRLATNREKLEEAANSPRVADLAIEGELGVRRADALIKKEGNGGGKTTKPPRSPKQPKGSGSPDLAELMKISGADEIKTALKHAEKFDEVTPSLEVQLRMTSPTAVAEILSRAWEDADVQRLIEELKTKPARPKPPMRPPNLQAAATN